MIKKKQLNDFDLLVNKSAAVSDRINSLYNAYKTSEKLSFFNNINIFNCGRSVESVEKNFQNVICTTYFTSKTDPQSKQKIESDSIDYISSWYNSVKELNIDGIVFYDNLSSEFVKKYKTKHITFLKCKLGDFSLNDERFIIYYMFFLKHKAKHVLFTDGNDVIVKKEPFKFFESKIDSTIFVGRGKENKIFQSKWNVSSVNKLIEGLPEGIAIPNNFYNMAIYNAGIIGGKHSTVLYFLRQICNLFLKLNNDKNNNMAAMHYVLYFYFYPNCRKYLNSWYSNFINKDFKILIFQKLKYRKMDFIMNEKINYSNDRIAISKHIYSGFPLNSKFYGYEKNSSAYLIHK